MCRLICDSCGVPDYFHMYIGTGKDKRVEVNCTCDRQARSTDLLCGDCMRAHLKEEEKARSKEEAEEEERQQELDFSYQEMREADDWVSP